MGAEKVTRGVAVSEGLPRYFTGVPCVNGHVSERYTANKTCCECANATAVVSKSKNRQKYAQSSAKWQRENPSKTAVYQLRATRKAPGKRNALTAKYRSCRDRRTPQWLTCDDLWVIGEAYDLAATRTKLFGFPWHVDHVVPLRGKTVSGLHVPWNLQVIPGTDNVKKGNSHG
jgi:hypothetical protein